MPDNKFVTSYERKFLRQIMAQDRAISVMFDEFTQAVSPLLSKYQIPNVIIKDIRWRNKDIELALQSELRRLQGKLQGYLTSETSKAWSLSADKTDLLVSDYIKNLGISDIAKKGLFNRHLDALKEFQTRKVAGMELSQRIWKISEQTKEQLELYLQSGLSSGQGAAKISRDIRQYLQNPDARFRRVRNKDGKLIPSKPMADYHPGQGVYRSAAKNALRMTRTETNMAYRISDINRWKDLDFVTGFEVKLSNSHKIFDICDHLAGKYPKNFIFSGWHSNCYCYMTSITMSDDQFIEYLDSDKIPEEIQVKGIPPAAAKYIKNASGNLAGYKNPPYWLRDNFKQRNGVYYPKAGIERPPKIAGAIKANMPVQLPFKRSDYNNYKLYPELNKKITALRRNDTVMRGMSNEDFVSLAGDTPEKGLTFNKVAASYYGDSNGGDIKFLLQTDKYFSRLEVHKYRNTILEINHIDIPASEQGKGLGSKMFLNTLESAKKNGFSKIELTAAKKAGYNGYYTWARYGFDFSPIYSQEIARFKSLVAKSDILEIKNSRNLKELFKTKQGADFWKENGFEFHGIFDVKLDYNRFIEYFRSKNYPR